jgi:hypothetical protein
VKGGNGLLQIEVVIIFRFRFGGMFF